MEYSEDRQFDPIPPEPEAAPAPEHTEEAPAETPEVEDTSWHGTGAGQQEFFTASPSDAWAEPESIPEPTPEPAPFYERTYTPQPEEYTVPKKRAKKSGGVGKKILAAVLAAAGAHIDDPVRRADDVEVVFDHDHGGAVDCTAVEGLHGQRRNQFCREHSHF